MLQTDPGFPDVAILLLYQEQCETYLVSRTFLPKDMWVLDLGVKVQRSKVDQYLLSIAARGQK